MINAATNTKAIAKVVVNTKNKNLFKVVIAFNVTQRNARTNALIFPQQAQCAYVSGDLSSSTLENEVSRCIETAKIELRTENIMLLANSIKALKEFYIKYNAAQTAAQTAIHA